MKIEGWDSEQGALLNVVKATITQITELFCFEVTKLAHLLKIGPKTE